MRAFGVEADDPFDGCQFDLVVVAPRSLPADGFVLERPDGGLGQRVVQRAPSRRGELTSPGPITVPSTRPASVTTRWKVAMTSMDQNRRRGRVVSASVLTNTFMARWPWTTSVPSPARGSSAPTVADTRS